MSDSLLSPLPWSARGRLVRQRLFGVADFYIEGDAAYAVRAANAYPRLVAALKAVTDDGASTEADFTAARALLAELEAQPQPKETR